MEATLLDQIISQAKTLPPDRQQNVLAYIHMQQSLNPAKTPPGTPGPEAARFAGIFTKEEAEQMMRVIEEDCERIDHDGW